MANLNNNTSSSDVTPDNRRLFGVYICYRLGMSALLIVLFLSGLGENILGANKPSIFLYTSYIYIGLCCLSATLYFLGKLTIQTKHILFLLLVDFVALVLVIHTSNSAIGGLGYLLLIPMAVGGTFLRGKTSVALAAFASLLIMLTSAFNSLENTESTQSFFTAGIAGILLFTTAITFRLLSKKIQRTEDEIQQQVEHADYLQRISERIIETIQAGIIVIDNQLDILLINHAAQDLLSEDKKLHSIEEINGIYGVLQKWRTHNIIPDSIMIHLGVNHDIKISFTKLEDPNITSLMLYIEDERRLNQEAQQLKLASLGRLTSSIAHEIRNPLGAISHASQLLDESDHIQADDQELLSMIQINSQRIDQTINNILQFSRRKESNPKLINTHQWLEKFRENYQPHTNSAIIINAPEQEIYCRVDPNHLQQIITNLVDNGLRHSNKMGEENIITIETSIDNTTNLPSISISDEGNGIDEKDINTVFEPFYTTKSTGSGLGLYLCKELCQANQANIIYLQKTKKQKSCFKLILCQPQQKI